MLASWELDGTPRESAQIYVLKAPVKDISRFCHKAAADLSEEHATTIDRKGRKDDHEVKNSPFYARLMDLTKAYYAVDREILPVIHKCSTCPPRMLASIRLFRDGVRARVPRRTTEPVCLAYVFCGLSMRLSPLLIFRLYFAFVQVLFPFTARGGDGGGRCCPTF